MCFIKTIFTVITINTAANKYPHPIRFSNLAEWVITFYANSVG